MDKVFPQIRQKMKYLIAGVIIINNIDQYNCAQRIVVD